MLYCVGQVLLVMSTTAAHKIDLEFFQWAFTIFAAIASLTQWKEVAMCFFESSPSGISAHWMMPKLSLKNSVGFVTATPRHWSTHRKGNCFFNSWAHRNELGIVCTGCNAPLSFTLPNDQRASTTYSDSRNWSPGYVVMRAVSVKKDWHCESLAVRLPHCVVHIFT